MVHALRRAGNRLVPGGHLISIWPHPGWRPLVSIVTSAQRMPVARLINPGFDRRLETAEAALHRVVDEGSFTLVGIQPHRYRARLDKPVAAAHLSRNDQPTATAVPRRQPGTAGCAVGVEGPRRPDRGDRISRGDHATASRTLAGSLTSHRLDARA